MKYTKDQLKAAYALNLCTISISQIIDYNDVNIMEQEYDAILNNINLEQIPKDEALLKILKQIMDTITFFRISDKEREFIERDYRMKMKNAIWSAVPNIGMIIGGGDWKTVLIAVATQVGIGYMNYRRAKAEGEYEKEKQLWELERTAIEQFNGLRRELFDTAWRLSAAYNYPDELRLTERQIKQYDYILMDFDPIRRYERLLSIKNQFLAYPPFWYYLAHTAVEISKQDIFISDQKREAYRQEAVQYYKQFRESNQQGLLREDPIASACALELIDLLNPSDEKEFILELIKEAIGFSGGKEDVLQLCAMAYIRIGEQKEAAVLLKQLVNEGYIPHMNAQLLSSIYVSEYIKEKASNIIDDYKLLQRRVGGQYLIPFPEKTNNPGESIIKFSNMQKSILERKYALTINELKTIYGGRYASILPVKAYGENDKINYYLLSGEQQNEMFLEIKKTFEKGSAADALRKKLKDTDIHSEILNLINDLFSAVSDFSFADESVLGILAKDIEQAFVANRGIINNLITKLHKEKFEFPDMFALMSVDFDDFTHKFFVDLQECMHEYIESLEEMQDFAIAEHNLVKYCERQGLSDPEKLYAQNFNMQSIIVATKERKFTSDLWEQKPDQMSQDLRRKLDLFKTIEKYKENIITEPTQAEFYSSKDPRTSRYFSSNSKIYNIKGLRQKTIAVLDSIGTKGGFDLIFTDSGIIPYRDGVVKSLILYKDIHWRDNNQQELIIGEPYKGYVADLQQMYMMIQELKQNCFVPSQGIPIWDAIRGVLGIK